MVSWEGLRTEQVLATSAMIIWRGGLTCLFGLSIILAAIRLSNEERSMRRAVRSLTIPETVPGTPHRPLLD
jgi:hypothetical protein